jgi:hypothetical protein
VCVCVRECARVSILQYKTGTELMESRTQHLNFSSTITQVTRRYSKTKLDT